jgi:serine/threonine protein kinase
MANERSYNFSPGHILASKYEVVSHVGSAYEGELYMLEERGTGIERTAKFFFPETNQGNRNTKYYARKLHKLRHCNALMQYRTQETIKVSGTPVTFMVSDFAEGVMLSDFLKSNSGKRLTNFECLHILYALVCGVEPMHNMGEYHGNIVMENIMVRRRGLGFQIKLMDLYNFGSSNSEMIRNDMVDMMRIFYDLLGGARTYSKHPKEIKAIICGLKKTLIKDRFRNAAQLRAHLETMEWY